MLVVVEDAQFLDSVTIQLLQTLSRQPGARGLIVLMMDSDQPRDGQVGTRSGPLEDWLDAADRTHGLTKMLLDPLKPEELTEIAVSELGTEVDSAMLARVVEQARGMPGILCDLLEAPAVSEALREGRAGPVDLTTIPLLTGVQAAFAAAPASIRKALSVASIHGPFTIRDWLMNLSLGITDEVIDDTIRIGWIRQRQGTQTVEFASPAILAVVRRARDRELTPDTISAVRVALFNSVVDAHADQTWGDLGPDLRESLLVCLIENDPENRASPQRDELTAELLVLRRASGRDAASQELLSAITQRLTDQHISFGVLTVTTAEALFDAGQHDKALQLLHNAYAELRAEHGEYDPRRVRLFWGDAV